MMTIHQHVTRASLPGPFIGKAVTSLTVATHRRRYDPKMSAAPRPAPDLRADDGSSDGGLQTLLNRDALFTHFQPIVNLRRAEIYGHESLIRGPVDSSLALPDALFEAARRDSLVTTLEYACVRVALESWAQRRVSGKLFINLSASALTSGLASSQFQTGMDFLARCGVPVSSLVVELTEHEHVGDVHSLHSAMELLRLHGVQLALDDFGDGRSSLRLWSELKPDYVKINKYFTRGLAEDADKLQTFRALLQIAETFGAQLVAEGIERCADLRVLRDLGVRYGQGWCLGRPQRTPVTEPLFEALGVLRGRDVAILPEIRMAAASRRLSAAQLLVCAPTVSPTTTHDELFRLLSQDESLHAVAVLRDEWPVALIDCQQFVNRYARPFFKELFGRRSCLGSANQQPLLVELDTGIEHLTALLTAGDQRYLREGFVITENGRYRGLGTGSALVKAVTEARIEAARHANPLTLLPGNILIGAHIERLLAGGAEFAAGHADLNHFKAYNDYYGYWRGDEMIRLAASVISAHCDPRRDFIGHIGGDDFIVLFQSSDWQARCERMVQEFNIRALELFDAPARAAGGIMAEDRHKQMRFHPCTSFSIGVAPVPAGRYVCAEEVSTAAAAATRLAKQQARGISVLR